MGCCRQSVTASRASALGEGREGARDAVPAGVLEPVGDVLGLIGGHGGLAGVVAERGEDAVEALDPGCVGERVAPLGDLGDGDGVVGQGAVRCRVVVAVLLGIFGISVLAGVVAVVGFLPVVGVLLVLLGIFGISVLAGVVAVGVLPGVGVVVGVLLVAGRSGGVERFR